MNRDWKACDMNMDLTNKKVLVVGGGISGVGAVTLLYQSGARPVFYDGNEKLTTKELQDKLPQGVEAQILIGTVPEEIKQEIELVVVSPGVPTDTDFINEYRQKKIPIWGEIELAYTFSKGKVVAITGTNGKTTTTTLVGEIMKNYYDSVFVVGNIGNPYTQIARKTGDETVTVAEISSFQLETIEQFAPKVSAILNITPDHLNRHHTMECYIQTKEAIAMNQTKQELCVLNYENEFTRAFGEKCPATVVYFSSAHTLENGYYYKDDTIFEAHDGVATALMKSQEMNLVGMCNIENVMAAIAISRGMQVPMDVILQTVKGFQAVEHRIEFVETKGGVDYYNDSKGTNPDAAIQGIKAMTKPTVLIGGGYDKGSEYDEWIEAFDGKVKALVLIGATRDKIAACAKAHGIENIIFEDTFEDAFATCVKQAKPGDAVLLSPACASWGMFPNYEVRGKMFKEMVRKLD